MSLLHNEYKQSIIKTWQLPLLQPFRSAWNLVVNVEDEEEIDFETLDDPITNET